MALDGRLDLSALESADYEVLVARAASTVIAIATPDRTDRLFPAAVPLAAGQGGCPASGACFGHGAAGVLFALAEAGAAVPDELVDWLVDAARRIPVAAPGFFDGLAGIAMTLGRLGRPDEAGELWDQVADVPLDLLGRSLSDGLPGIGLAMLERTPVPECDSFVRTLEAIGGALLDRLTTAPSRSGLLDGGAGAALFLLNLYELTENPLFLDGAERALADDVAAVGWGLRSPRTHHTPEEASFWTGTDGITMVLHEAARHSDSPWLHDAHRHAAAVCQDRLDRLECVFHARVSTLLAVHYVSTGPWTPPERRRALTRLHMGRLELMPADVPLHQPGGVPVRGARANGTAALILALSVLTGRSRLPFFS